MVRRAIVVGAPSAEGAAYLAGVGKDMNAYFEFLCSPFGGAWAVSEIVRLNSPTWSDLHAELAVPAEFVLTIFSGHGEYRDQQSRIAINYGEQIRAVEDFRAHNAPRQLTILDTCRYIEPERRLAEDKVGSGTIGSLPDAYWMQCRAAFDQAVISAPPSREIMFACAIGETSADGPGGGLFSRSLIGMALQWAREARAAHGPYGSQRFVLQVPEAFAYAKAETERYNLPEQQQHPELYTHRGFAHVPFAVV